MIIFFSLPNLSQLAFRNILLVKSSHKKTKVENICTQNTISKQQHPSQDVRQNSSPVLGVVWESVRVPAMDGQAGRHLIGEHKDCGTHQVRAAASCDGAQAHVEHDLTQVVRGGHPVKQVAPGDVVLFGSGV